MYLNKTDLSAKTLPALCTTSSCCLDLMVMILSPDVTMFHTGKSVTLSLVMVTMFPTMTPSLSVITNNLGISSTMWAMAADGRIMAELSTPTSSTGRAGALGLG